MRYCTLSFLAVVCVGTLAHGAEGGPKSAADVFGPAKLHAMTITLTEQAWEDMQPLQGIRPNAPRDRRPPTAGPDGKPAPTPAQAAAAKPRETVVSQFGYEFPFAKGTIEFHGTVYKDVGLRFKGNSAYMTASDGLKRPIKLDFDRHVPGQKFFGMSSLNLCNNSFDPSQMREVMSYRIYEAAGVPSPRTAYAEVFLTVPNRFDKEYVGSSSRSTSRS